MVKTCRKCVIGDGRRGMTGNATTVLAVNAGSSSLKFGIFIVCAAGGEALIEGSEALAGDAPAAIAGIAAALATNTLPPPTVALMRTYQGDCSLRIWATVPAVADGPSVDTGMGLTPSGGVIMSTRCGHLDPACSHASWGRGFTVAPLQDLIDVRSGLLGISDISGDVRALHGAAASDSQSGTSARLAITMFC